jgi:hypothetical protein
MLCASSFLLSTVTTQPAIDAIPATSSQPARIEGVSSPSLTPLISATMEALPPASQPGMHLSTLPSTPTAPALKADFVGVGGMGLL